MQVRSHRFLLLSLHFCSHGYKNHINNCQLSTLCTHHNKKDFNKNSHMVANQEPLNKVKPINNIELSIFMWTLGLQIKFIMYYTFEVPHQGDELNRTLKIGGSLFYFRINKPDVVPFLLSLYTCNYTFMKWYQTNKLVWRQLWYVHRAMVEWCYKQLSKQCTMLIYILMSPNLTT